MLKRIAKRFLEFINAVLAFLVSILLLMVWFINSITKDLAYHLCMGMAHIYDALGHSEFALWWLEIYKKCFLG